LFSRASPRRSGTSYYRSSPSVARYDRAPVRARLAFQPVERITAVGIASENIAEGRNDDGKFRRELPWRIEHDDPASAQAGLRLRGGDRDLGAQTLVGC